jgi:hypothetical protein
MGAGRVHPAQRVDAAKGSVGRLERLGLPFQGDGSEDSVERAEIRVQLEELQGSIEVGRLRRDEVERLALPPTMSPSETSHEPGLLEHPADAFAYFLTDGVPKVVVEEKHYTRTGRRFFDVDLEVTVLDRVRAAMDGARTWDELATDWVQGRSRRKPPGRLDARKPRRCRRGFDVLSSGLTRPRRGPARVTG